MAHSEASEKDIGAISGLISLLFLAKSDPKALRTIRNDGTRGFIPYLRHSIITPLLLQMSKWRTADLTPYHIIEHCTYLNFPNIETCQQL